jgi:uncharacterized SAM-binding protein YcdF (DUF218 family)
MRYSCLAHYFIFCLQFTVTCLIQTGCAFRNYAHKAYEKAVDEKPYDVIIVPGIPYEEEKTSHLMKDRLNWAKFLYDSGFTKNIIFSGAAVHTPFVEGIVMKTMADSLGIPPDKTFCEIKAEHGTENAYYSWLMAKELGFRKIAFATDAIQARALARFIKKRCEGMKVVPIVVDKINPIEAQLPVVDPKNAEVENFIPIEKREGFFKRFSYSLGKRVKDEVKERKRNDDSIVSR